MNFISTWWKRFKSETPVFWRRIRNISIFIFTGALALYNANNTMDLNLDPQIMDICRYVIAVSITLGLSAQTTTSDKNLSK